MKKDRCQTPVSFAHAQGLVPPGVIKRSSKGQKPADTKLAQALSDFVLLKMAP
jgi:hypothetical protein